MRGDPEGRPPAEVAATVDEPREAAAATADEPRPAGAATVDEPRPAVATAGPSRRPTMREVAALAGVSLSTVSRVVNGGTGVREDLVDRVRDAVEMLGYRHNLTASALRRSDRQSASIGVIFEDVSNPFFSLVHRGVEEIARERGVLVLAGSSDEEPERERQLADAFGSRGVDGLIIVPASLDHSYLLRDRAAGVAMVFVDRPAGAIDADAVVSDNAGGTATAVDHLVAAGHRRIGFLGDQPDIFTAAERLRGYRAALARHGLEEDVSLVRHPRFRGVGAYETTIELLRGKNPPTALFTGQNLITVAAVRALHDLGLHHEIALVSFDDVLLADVVEPALTVVSQDPLRLGREGADLLFSRLDGYEGPSRRVMVPTTLIVRGSGELPPPTT